MSKFFRLLMAVVLIAVVAGVFGAASIGSPAKVPTTVMAHDCEGDYIDLSQSGVTSVVGQMHTVSALASYLYHDTGSCWLGYGIFVDVTFTVTGANPTSEVVTTDQFGYACFSYTGQNAGTDTIVASWRVATSTVDVTWVGPSYRTWDINQDWKVDYKDLAILGSHYGETTSTPHPAWDINQDGKVDYKDLAILGAHYGQEIVTFPDPYLQAAIREAISKPTGDIYQSDLTGLTSLDTASDRIADLTGLEHCTSLTHLSSVWGWIFNLSPLSGLTSLTYLDLSGNHINDVSPLVGLTSLTYLDLSWNQIGDIGPLVDNVGLSDGDSVNLEYNLLDAVSISTYIPQLSARGVSVVY